MDSDLSLLFENVSGTSEYLWYLSGLIEQNSSYEKPDNWLLTYRSGIRGMFARIIAVDRHYDELHKFQIEFEKKPGNPNIWLQECEYHAGLIFFGIDSSIECFVFALNALGCAKDKNAFLDITDSKKLSRINPKNIFSNPEVPGYQMYFPKIRNFFKINESLVNKFIEYHDVSKHRSSIAQGGNIGDLKIRENPKSAGSTSSSSEHTVQSLSKRFQKFIDELLDISANECSSVFGYDLKNVLKGMKP